MKPTATLPTPQQLRARLDSNGVLDLVTDEYFADTLRTHLPAHRQRLYPPIETLAMFVSQTLSDDRSCQCVVDERIARSLARDTLTPNSSTGAYCAARQRLPLPLVSELCRQVAQRARDIARAKGCLPEHDTLLIDGTASRCPTRPRTRRTSPSRPVRIAAAASPRGAVQRRHFLAGAIPARQGSFQPVAAERSTGGRSKHSVRRAPRELSEPAGRNAQ